MATPNLLSLTTITPGTDSLTVSGSAVAIVTAGASNAIKINVLIVTNTTASAATLNVYLYRSTVDYDIITALSIPANSTFAISKVSGVYLEASDALRLSSGTASALKATVSYEDLS